MASRIRKNSKRLKRSIKKHKYIGGITLKSGLHAFFVNKAEWIKLFGEVVKDKNAPSIKDIEEKLKGKGYYIADKNIFIDLIGVNGSKDSSSYEKNFLQSDCVGVQTFKPGSDSTYVPPVLNIKCHAFMLNKEFDTSDDSIQDVFGLIHNHMLFSNIVNTNDKFSIVNNPLNIDYCVVIDVNQLKRNKYIQSVNYELNEDRDKRAKNSVENSPQEKKYIELCADYKKQYFGYDDPLQCRYKIRNTRIEG